MERCLKQNHDFGRIYEEPSAVYKEIGRGSHRDFLFTSWVGKDGDGGHTAFPRVFGDLAKAVFGRKGTKTKGIGMKRKKAKAIETLRSDETTEIGRAHV